MDDVATYQELGSTKEKTMSGVDTAVQAAGNAAEEEEEEAEREPRVGEWDWRGKGFLRVAGLRWEVLGWGDLDGESGAGEEEEEGRAQWAVTYFGSTLFTSPGLDIYSRRKAGLPQAVLEEIMAGLRGVGQEIEVFGKLVEEVYECVHD
jgi:hypothetical protein